MRPMAASQREGTRFPLDKRRWEGRSHSASGINYDKVQRACKEFHDVYQRVLASELTGNVMEDDPLRLANAVHINSSVLFHA